MHSNMFLNLASRFTATKKEMGLEVVKSVPIWARFLTANSRWHRAMAIASHNPILTTIYDALGPGLLDPHVAGFASAEVRAAVVLAVGKVEEAIIAGDAATARRRMERHVLAYRAQAERVAPKIVTL